MDYVDNIDDINMPGNEEQFNNYIDNENNINDIENIDNLDHFNNKNNIGDNIDDIKNINNFNDINELKDINFENNINLENIDNMNEIQDLNQRANNINNLNNININHLEHIEDNDEASIDNEVMPRSTQPTKQEQENNNDDLNNRELMINDINEHFMDLQQRFEYLGNENKQLKRQLAIEKNKNKKIPPNKLKILENSINQGKILLDKTKKKNAELIKDYETKKDELNLQLIEANQKIKRLEEDLNQAKNNNSNNGNNNEDSLNEINKLKNKIDEYEINISKLNLENKNLIEKIDKIKKDFKDEKITIINYKNSEIKSYRKLIEEYDKYFKNNNINIKNKENNLQYNGNNNLDQEKMMMELKNKDKIIKSLYAQKNKYDNQFKNIIEVEDLLKQTKVEYEQLAKEKMKLQMENEKYKNSISNIFQKFKKVEDFYDINKYQINQYGNEKKELISKIDEYKRKIITLKKKVNELYAVIDKLKNSKYQASTNNSNYNNFIDIKPLPSTPNQMKKMPIMNNQTNSYYNNPSLLKIKNGNQMINNINNLYGNTGNTNLNRNKNRLSNEELEIRQKKSVESYKKFISQLEQNMPNPKP